MKLRLRRPRELGRLLLSLARLRPREVEEYLDRRPEEWEALAGASPSDAAHILGELSDQAASDLLTDLEPTEAAGVLAELPPRIAAELLEELERTEAAGLLEEMSTESATDIVAELEEATRTELLGIVEPAAAEDIRRLLGYPPDSAGGLMTTEVARLPVGLTAGEAVERIRRMHEEIENLSYVYVVDDENRLEGVISFRDLVFTRPGEGLDEAMVANPVAVQPETDREEIADLIQQYHLFGLPVVDSERRLLGMVATDAVIDAVAQEASEDFGASVGAGAGETPYTPPIVSMRSRAPWLGVNLGLTLLIALVVNGFTGVISREPVLAALMPVIASLGGNAGSQSLAVVIRALAVDDIPGSRARDVVVRQLVVGILNGLVLALAASALSFLLISAGVLGSGSPALRVAAVVLAAVVINLTVAGLAGGGIPILLRRLGLDPALASSIFLTMVTDMVGFGGFLLVGSLLL
ncbi:MAG TPA: magnesium transporter [Acidimicrobiia bacterium]|nr:magnesium transporter [Acidimicrobiia bacterium]